MQIKDVSKGQKGWFLLNVTCYGGQAHTGLTDHTSTTWKECHCPCWIFSKDKALHNTGSLQQRSKPDKKMGSLVVWDDWDSVWVSWDTAGNFDHLECHPCGDRQTILCLGQLWRDWLVCVSMCRPGLQTRGRGSREGAIIALSDFEDISNQLQKINYVH